MKRRIWVQPARLRVLSESMDDISRWAQQIGEGGMRPRWRWKQCSTPDVAEKSVGKVAEYVVE